MGGRNNRKNTPRKASQAGTGTKPTRDLAWQQYQELNFSFYREQPSDFINMRIELLSLLLCSEEQLAPAYAAQRSIKGMQLGGATPPDEEKRRRVLQTETIVILHHAAEMLFRLFYAHLEDKSCPWKGMASLTNFAEFKGKLDKALTDGFDRDELAQVFLGGTSPTDACVAMTAEEFEDAIDGLDLLLVTAANRLLGDAFLYNSIKHGLSTIALDESTQIAHRSEGGEPVVGHKGPMFAFMHKQRRPAERDDREWFISMVGVRTEQDLALALLIARAVESLWDVARRNLIGQSGTIRYIKRSVVETVVYGLLMDALNIVKGVAMEMPKLLPDGSFGDVEYDVQMHHVPEDYKQTPGEHFADCPHINLPARQKDQRVFSTSQRALFPFSPNGSQQV